MSTLTDLIASVSEVSRLENELAQAREKRNSLTRDYLAEGATVYTTAKLLGVTRQSVMRFRDSDA